MKRTSSEDKEVVFLPKVKKGEAAAEMNKIVTEDSGRVFILDHASMRMKEREITRRQVMKVLRHGDIVSGPEWTTEPEKGWKFEYRRISAGECLYVIAKLIERERICCLVVTVYRR